MDSNPISIYIIEDDAVILESLKSIIESEQEFKYCGGTHTAEDGIINSNRM